MGSNILDCIVGMNDGAHTAEINCANVFCEGMRVRLLRESHDPRGFNLTIEKVRERSNVLVFKERMPNWARQGNLLMYLSPTEESECQHT